MIVCSCNRISDHEIARAVDDLMMEDPVRVITPALVYRALGKRPRCGGCLSHAGELAHKRAACLRGCHDGECKHVHGGQPRDQLAPCHAIWDALAAT